VRRLGANRLLLPVNLRLRNSARLLLSSGLGVASSGLGVVSPGTLVGAALVRRLGANRLLLPVNLRLRSSARLLLSSGLGVVSSGLGVVSSSPTSMARAADSCCRLVNTPASIPYGESGATAWMNLLSGSELDAEWFGCSLDGSTDSGSV